MTSLRFVVASGLLLAATSLRADEPTSAKAPAQAEYRRPELVAMTWQSWLKTNVPERKPVVWRPDGSLLDTEEIDWLCNDLSPSSFPWRSSSGQLRPLVLVFRIDERAKVQQSLRGSVLSGDQVRGSGYPVPSTKSFLAQTILVPTRAELAAWPEDIDVEIKVPVGEPEIMKSFDGVPQGELKLAEGVRWYVDPNRGQRVQSGKRVPGAPAAVFEIDERQADPLSTISCAVRLKNGTLLRDESTMVVDDGLASTTTRVSAPLEESNPIVKVEFKRLRYRLERYEKLPTHLDLKPPEAARDVPDVPVLRLR
jgi:hypothetical protein